VDALHRQFRGSGQVTVVVVARVVVRTVVARVVVVARMHVHDWHP
jgi:hypothetical protein